MNRDPSVAVPFKAEKAATARQASAGDRRARWQALGKAALRMLGAMALSALVVLGASEVWAWATRSPFFDARAVRFRGAVHAGQDELLMRSGLKAGQNLFRANLAAAARGVESSPWVIAASVSRRFPPAFEVEVVEHVPAAQVQLGRVYLADIEGRVFKRLDDQDPADVRALPIVTGLARTEWDDQRAQAQPKLASALQLINDWAAEGLAPALLAELHADEGGGFTVQVRTDGEKPQQVRVGLGPFRPKLRRYAQVRSALVRRGEKAAHIDLDNQTRPEWVAAQLTNDSDSPARRP